MQEDNMQLEEKGVELDSGFPNSESTTKKRRIFQMVDDSKYFAFFLLPEELQIMILCKLKPTDLFCIMRAR
jgi:hypothetical protein